MQSLAVADVSSPEAILRWIQPLGPTLNKARGVLEPEELAFPLVGRDEAVSSIEAAFANLHRRQTATVREGTDRTSRKIPVCSALSGTGKTRLAEEWPLLSMPKSPSRRWVSSSSSTTGARSRELREKGWPAEAVFACVAAPAPLFPERERTRVQRLCRAHPG